jgi:hypothetical protein
VVETTFNLIQINQNDCPKILILNRFHRPHNLVVKIG